VKEGTWFAWGKPGGCGGGTSSEGERCDGEVLLRIGERHEGAAERADWEEKVRARLQTKQLVVPLKHNGGGTQGVKVNRKKAIEER
jgi:putative heme degradation protein